MIQGRMYRLFVLTLLSVAILSFSGCGELTRIKLIGTWEADIAQTTLGSLGINTEPSSNPLKNVVNTIIKETAEGIANAVSAKERIDFKHDGTFTAVMIVGGSEVASVSGTWSVAKSSGDDATLSLIYANGGESRSIAVKLVGDDEIEALPLFGATAGERATYRRLDS